jgi:hypothetical protein
MIGQNPTQNLCFATIPMEIFKKAFKTNSWDYGNGMLLSIEKKSLFVKKVACHDFRE